jgi:Domain of unknown function (DUF1876)
MGTTKLWTVEIFLDEGDLGTTRATARLDTSDDAHLHGRGSWQSADEEEPSEVGDDVAVAEALSQIAAGLTIRAAGDGSGREAT